jgi:LuxR family maltose regulon positive regulatory protein
VLSGPGAGDGVGTAHVLHALASHDTSRAAALLERWPLCLEDLRNTIERAISTAVYLDATGDADGAARSLLDALALAERDELRQPFLEVPSVLRRVRQLPRGASGDFVGSILAARTPLDAPTRANGQLIEPLTDRELAVIDYLPTRLSNREIAAQLYVSVNTLKTHLRNIYRKLDVTDRDAAVDRATALGLL